MPYVKTPLQHYRNQEAAARQRGIAFLLTFEEWWGIWQSSGKWELRGSGRGKYCMARTNDVGPYAVGNVRIERFEANCAESTLRAMGRL
jgi:hypothetical protein